MRASTAAPESYRAMIATGLDAAFAAAETVEVEAAALKAVVFSDLHRGARDRADDFQRCERAYAAALGWYLEQGYELWLLGDVEELWENDPAEVLPAYRELLELEREFAHGPGLRRFFGNHDGDWREPRLVARHLGPWLAGTRVQEALRIRVLDGGTPVGQLLLAHGHQGTSTADRWAPAARLLLRRLWRPLQAWRGWMTTTPAQDHALRYRHDRAMHAWARARALAAAPGERPILIAGHTHHPVFPGEPPPQATPAEAARLSAALGAETDPARRGERRAELEALRVQLRDRPYKPPAARPPCYVNAGCGCYPDRDVTGVEIHGAGELRLVRWLDDDGRPRPKVLAATPLRELFAS